MVVNNVAHFINQVALDIHKAAFFVCVARTRRVLLQDGGSVGVSVEVALDALDVELGEGEDLWEFSVLQVRSLPDLTFVRINDVSLFVNQVSSLINSTAQVVEQLSLSIVLGDNVSILVFVELAHHVLNVKALAIVVEQLVQVFIVELAFIKFLSSVFVDNVALAWQHVPAVLVHTSSFLVNEESLARLHKDRLAVRVIEVTHNLMGIEVEFLNAVGSWHFTTLVHLVVAEHRLAGHVLNDIAGLWVGQVAALVDWLALFIVFPAVLVFQYNDVTFIVSVHVTEDVVLVESAEVSIWWDRNCCFLSGLEVLHHVLVNIHDVRHHVLVIVRFID